MFKAAATYDEPHQHGGAFYVCFSLYHNECMEDVSILGQPEATDDWWRKQKVRHSDYHKLLDTPLPLAREDDVDFLNKLSNFFGLIFCVV